MAESRIKGSFWERIRATKTKTIIVLGCFGLILTACGQVETPELVETRARHTSSTLLPGTCLNACDGQSLEGECWCDAWCEIYNDCCADKVALCDEPTYDPCEDKECGENCTACDPQDPDCFETEVLKQCSQDGLCEVGPAECGCPPVQCEIACTNGLATDENGCQICECIECPSSEAICDALCAGEPEPIVPAGCPIPSCACPDPIPCGGLAGLTCPDDYRCIDYPDDDCEPGIGADCMGIATMSPRARKLRRPCILAHSAFQKPE